MSFCAQCPHRSAACWRHCRRLAHGQHMWQVMQGELRRDKPPLQHAPTFAEMPEDWQRALIVGADAMWTMEH